MEIRGSGLKLVKGGGNNLHHSDHYFKFNDHERDYLWILNCLKRGTDPNYEGVENPKGYEDRLVRHAKMLGISEEQAKIDYRAAIAEARRTKNAELLEGTTQEQIEERSEVKKSLKNLDK